jgi:hypothetical protein
VLTIFESRAAKHSPFPEVFFNASLLPIRHLSAHVPRTGRCGPRRKLASRRSGQAEAGSDFLRMSGVFFLLKQLLSRRLLRSGSFWANCEPTDANDGGTHALTLMN